MLYNTNRRKNRHNKRKENPNMSQPTKFYTISQFAKAIGVHPQTLRRWDKEGTLKPITRSYGHQRRYTQEQVDAYLAKQQ